MSFGLVFFVEEEKIYIYIYTHTYVHISNYHVEKFTVFSFGVQFYEF